MKIIALGDTHGRLNWKDIAAKELATCDKFIFIGDYFDTHEDVTAEQQIQNFIEIVALKRANPDKVVLLIGNHDFHYTGFAYNTYSGYQYGAAPRINEILTEALKDGLMQMCFKHDKFVFTHAGVTKTWANANKIDVNDLENSINELFKTQPRFFDFTMGGNFSQTGNDVTQTPIWVRPQSLIPDMIDDVVCVVGHTTVMQMGLLPQFPTIILIDCLGTTGEYLVIEDGKPKPSKIND